MNINLKTLKTEKILEMDKKDIKRIPFYQKVLKLSEEIGELEESFQYFGLIEQLEEMYDTYNVCLVILHVLKESKLNKDFLNPIIESAEPKKPNLKNVSIYIGKINSALLLKEKSLITSKSTDESYLEIYVIEVLKEMISFLKYSIDLIDDYIFEEMIDAKIEKWEEKQEESL